jgi:hypothetical protein
MTPPQPGDVKAGFTGLIVAVVLLFAAMFTIVQLTNAAFEGHERPKAEAGK